MNAGGSIYTYTNNDASPWQQIPGAGTDIGAAADGTVWHVNSVGDIYRYTGGLPG
nr:tectonin domain-containing protein [Streptomyces flaveolus]